MGVEKREMYGVTPSINGCTRGVDFSLDDIIIVMPGVNCPHAGVVHLVLSSTTQVPGFSCSGRHLGAAISLGPTHVRCACQAFRRKPNNFNVTSLSQGIEILFRRPLCEHLLLIAKWEGSIKNVISFEKHTVGSFVATPSTSNHHE